MSNDYLVAGDFPKKYSLFIINYSLIQPIGCFNNFKLRPSVYLVADVLFVRRQTEDKRLVKGLVNRDKRIFFVQRLVRHHGLGFTISDRCKSLFFNAVRHQEVTTALCTFLTQLLVERLVAHKVGVRTQLDGDVRVVGQQLH